MSAIWSLVANTLMYASSGQTGLPEDLLHQQCRLRTVRGVLEQHGVAEHEVRRREAGDLVVREVPRHHADERTDRPAVDHGFVRARHVEPFRLEQGRAVVGVVAVDRRGELDLAVGLADGLAHLEGDHPRQFVFALRVEIGGSAQNPGAFLGGGRPPVEISVVGAGERRLHSCIVQGREFPDGFTGRGIDSLVLRHTAGNHDTASRIPHRNRCGGQAARDSRKSCPPTTAA